jgi:hypothetical protein
MRWPVKARLGLAAILVAAWWISINVAWVEVGDKQLTGGELAGWLNLVPAIALAALFIAGYGRVTKTLGVLSALVLGYSALVTLTFDWVENKAVTEILEQISGVMNADQHQAGVTLVTLPAVFISGVIGIVAATASLTAVFSKGKSQRTIPAETEVQFSDNRALWDEQS